MSGCATPAERSVFATSLLPSGEALIHPGGLGLTRRALDLASLPAGARVLDVGCGAGESLRLLDSLGFHALGIDSAADGDIGSSCIRGTAESLPLPDASFDGVLVECSLSVMGRQRQAVSECARVLVPGGRLILCDLYARAPEAIQRVRALSRSCVAGILARADIEGWLRSAGFRLDLWEDHSAALREFVARFLMQGGEPHQLWGCNESSAGGSDVAEAMRAVRAGYFLLVASRASRPGENP